MQATHLASDPPAVSVLLPVRDAENTLDEALRSIRDQTLKDWELIAVNDGSSDASGAIVDRHAADDPRVRVVHLPSPKGIVGALEAGRARAQAPLLARMDADDRAVPDRLEAQTVFLDAHPKVALCGTHVRYFPRASVRGGARRYEAWLSSLASSHDLLRDLWVECPLAHPTFMMRSAALEAVGGYRDMGWPEDYDLVLRFRAAGHELGVIPRVLLDWREGADRLSRTHERYSPAAFRAVKLHFLRKLLLPDRDGIVLWGAGPVGKAFARDALALDIPVRAFVELNPRKLGQEIHGAPVVSPDEAPRLHTSLHVAAVGQPGARERIRRTLRDFGWEETRDFVAVA